MYSIKLSIFNLYVAPLAFHSALLYGGKLTLH